MNAPHTANESIQRLERLAALLQQEVALLRTMTVTPPAQTPQSPASLNPPGANMYDASPPPKIAAIPAAVPEAIATPQPPALPTLPRFRFDAARSSEFWLNKIGIGLLLLGVAFLFKYSVDQGWLTPAIRCVVGLLIGGVLAGLGLRMTEQRREFGHVLLGGGIATFYITGFAAFQWYSLVAYPLALLFMIGVTASAFALAVRRDAVALAVIGALGGLGTPFLLNTGRGSVVGLMLYTVVLLAGIGAIYLVRGWRSLWWTAFVGGWCVTAIGVAMIDMVRFAPLGDEWALQLGVLAAVAVGWAVPVLRHMLHVHDPKRWPQPSLGVLAHMLPALPTDRAPLHVYAGVALTPFIALGTTQWIWTLADQTWGALFVLAAAVYGTTCTPLVGRVAGTWLAQLHALLAALLTTIGVVLLLNGPVLLVMLAAQALVLLVLAQRLGMDNLRWGGHALWAIIGVWLLDLLDGRPGGTAIFNGAALAQLATIGLAVAASFALPKHAQTWTYRVAAYGALLAWFGRELALLPNGNGYVSVAWGGLGIAALVAGLQRDLKALRILGMGTLALVVAKLLVVDLQEVEAIWRILLSSALAWCF